MRFPNQVDLHICKTKLDNNFTSVNKDAMFEALKHMTSASSIKLYLYLCGFANDTKLSFSPQAVSNATGMPARTITDAKNKLFDLGLLYEVPGKGYFFRDSLNIQSDGNPPKKESDGDPPKVVNDGDSHKLPEERLVNDANFDGDPPKSVNDGDPPMSESDGNPPESDHQQTPVFTSKTGSQFQF